MFERIFTKTKSVEMTDEQIIEKIKSLVGQKITIMGLCGNVEQAHIVKYVGLAREYNPPEFRFETDNFDYKTVVYNLEAIKNWKYNKKGILI